MTAREVSTMTMTQFLNKYPQVERISVHIYRNDDTHIEVDVFMTGSDEVLHLQDLDKEMQGDMLTSIFLREHD